MRKALYTQGYKPTGRSSPLLDFLLRYLPQMLPLSQVPKVVQKTGRSLKTKPEFQETRTLIALFKDVFISQQEQVWVIQATLPSSKGRRTVWVEESVSPESPQLVGCSAMSLSCKHAHGKQKLTDLFQQNLVVLKLKPRASGNFIFFYQALQNLNTGSSLPVLKKMRQ